MKQGRPPMSVETAISSYIEYRRAHEAINEVTLEDYGNTVRIVANALKNGNRNNLPWQINAEDVNWLIHVYYKDKNYKIKTMKGYTFALKAWMEYYDNYTIKKMRMHWPHDMRPTVKWLTLAQAQKLLNIALTPMQELVIHLELCLGLRRIEIARLRLDDVHNEYVDVTGKGSMGGKPRRLPTHPDTERVFARYLEYRSHLITRAKDYSKHPVTIPDELFIWERSGKLSNYESTSCSGVDRAVIERINHSHQLSFHIDNHTLRRTFGREMFRSGCPLETLAKMYGHESTSETLRYISLTMDDMISGMQKTPFSKNKKR